MLYLEISIESIISLGLVVFLIWSFAEILNFTDEVRGVRK